MALTNLHVSGEEDKQKNYDLASASSKTEQ